MVDLDRLHQPHNTKALMMSLGLAVVLGLGLFYISDDMTSPITGYSVREVGKAPTTPEQLEICNILYEDYLKFCDVAYEDATDCYKEAKQECYNCVYDTKNPRNEHLVKYCYK